MKILIVDDDNTFRLVLDATLRKFGHQVVALNDGSAAWELLQREYFPVLITDWLMPGIDGPDLIRRVRARLSDEYTYVIMLTVLGGKQSYLDAIYAGADDFISKPFDDDELVARLSVAERLVCVHNHVKRLEKLLPICSYCKSVRKDSGSWIRIEEYLATQTELTSISHGICPVCYHQHVKPELERYGIRVDESKIQ